MDESFEKDLADLVDMIKLLERIKDRKERRWLKAEIRNQLRNLLKD